MVIEESTSDLPWDNIRWSNAHSNLWLNKQLEKGAKTTITTTMKRTTANLGMMTNNDHDDEDDEEDEDDGDVVSGKNWAESRGEGTLFVPSSHKIRPFLKFWWISRNYLWIALLPGGEGCWWCLHYLKNVIIKRQVGSNAMQCSFTLLPNTAKTIEMGHEISNIYVHNVLSPKSQQQGQLDMSDVYVELKTWSNKIHPA